MNQRAQAYLNTHKLQALLQWAEEVTEGSEGNFNSAAKRAVAIYLAHALDRTLDRAHAPTLGLAHALDLALTRALALVRNRALVLARAHTLVLALALAYELRKIKIFKSVNFTDLISKLEVLRVQVLDDNLPYEVRRAFDDQTLQLWLEALYLDPEVAKLTEDEVYALNAYFYTNELIVRCKEAAVRVSPEVWAGIEGRMVTGRMRDEGAIAPPDKL
ncbi:MAG: hypothetical protein HC878_18180 [Leptolyngbyaceae cyanobacterium SL_5_14]|nr:hypothetical protein [Leptolyngbyaceae cyanobacterium SL_5_14]